LNRWFADLLTLKRSEGSEARVWVADGLVHAAGRPGGASTPMRMYEAKLCNRLAALERFGARERAPVMKDTPENP
jgi:hypothetical protein